MYVETHVKLHVRKTAWCTCVSSSDKGGVLSHCSKPRYRVSETRHHRNSNLKLVLHGFSYFIIYSLTASCMYVCMYESQPAWNECYSRFEMAATVGLLHVSGECLSHWLQFTKLDRYIQACSILYRQSPPVYMYNVMYNYIDWINKYQIRYGL